MLTTPLPDSSSSAAAEAVFLHYVLLCPEHSLPLHWLNTTELQWLSGKSAKRARSFAWSRALLRHLCVEQLQVLPEQVQISLPSEAAPELYIKGQRYFCSVSHSQHVVAVLLSPLQPVGLDIEYICHKRDKQQYALLYPALLNFCDSNEAFYQRWTQLEASLKLKGGQLLTMLAQAEPRLARQLICWQQQRYQFCVASQQQITQLNQLQLQQLP